MPARRAPWLLILALAGCDQGPDATGLTDAAASAGPVCAFDESTDPASALPLSPGAPTTGHLCPVGDADWYRLTVPAGHALVHVALAMEAVVSPVEATWSLRADDGAGAAVAGPAPSAVGGPLASTHCVAPGAYALVVRDQGDDAQDRRTAYRLQIDTAPDPDAAEPDGSPAQAQPLGASATGHIACRGDEDWYAVEVGPQALVRFALTAPAGPWQPRLRVADADGNTLISLTNPAGIREATDLRRAVAAPPGRVYLVVSDDDGADADPGAIYTLTAEATAELDAFEPNETAAEATPLDALTCGPDWTPWQVREGTFGRVGDTDWFRLPLEGCGQGLIEAELSLPTDDLSPAAAWALQAGLQPSLAVVRGHEDSPCDADEACRALHLSCQDAWGCAGYGNVCLADSRCAGATACLPEGHCGAFRVERHPTARPVPEPVVEAPPPLGARVSAPLERRAALYLRIS
ncbi:MAG: hypothetical protein KC549_05675, partial [Myxococcales bacterium]|nr:hypothetical protein [Myxococcales bacterium]